MSIYRCSLCTHFDLECSCQPYEHIIPEDAIRWGGAAWNKGMKGIIFTEEHKANMTAANKMRGKNHTPEARAKISMGMKGKKKSPEHIANNVAARRGLKPSAETRAKMAAARKGKSLSPESRAKVAEARKRYWTLKRASTSPSPAAVPP